MFYLDIQCIIALTERIRDIEHKAGSAYQFLRITLAVHLDRSKGSHTFQLQEIAFSGLFMNGEMLLVGGGTMQVAVLQLAVTVITSRLLGTFTRKVPIFFVILSSEVLPKLTCQS